MFTDNYEKIATSCLLFLTAVAVTVALIYTKVVLVPFVFSLFAYLVFSPVVQFLEHRVGFPRYLSMAVTIAGFLLLSGLILFFVVSSIGSFLQGTELYQDRIVETLKWLSEELEKYGLELNEKTIRQELNKLHIFSLARGITRAIFVFVANFFLVVVMTLFLIAGEGRQGIDNELYNEIEGQVSKYISLKFLISLTTGVLAFSVLRMFGVELAFMFGVLTAVLNFIPSLGSIVATLLPVPVLLLQFGITWPMFLVLGLLTLIQITIGYFVEPKLLGDSMELHPITVLICLIFWGLVWGIPGLFLAVPITAAFRIVLSRIELTEPISELLAGRIPTD